VTSSLAVNLRWYEQTGAGLPVIRAARLAADWTSLPIAPFVQQLHPLIIMPRPIKNLNLQALQKRNTRREEELTPYEGDEASEIK
jgi:hypothetical protein